MKNQKSLKTKLKEKALVQSIKANPLVPIKTHLKALNFSSNAQNQPGTITNRPSFIELMDKAGITDDKLTNKLY